MHLHKYLQTTHPALLQAFYRSNWILRVNGMLQFWKDLTHQGSKMSQRESSCLLMEDFWSRLNFTIWNRVFTLPFWKLLKPWTLSFQTDTITAKAVSPLKCLKQRTNMRFILHLKDLVLHLSVRTWDTFSVIMLAVSLKWCWEERDLTNQTLLKTLSPYILSWYTRTWLSRISLATRKPIAALLSFHFTAQIWRHYNYWTVHELSDL